MLKVQYSSSRLEIGIAYQIVRQARPFLPVLLMQFCLSEMGWSEDKLIATYSRIRTEHLDPTRVTQRTYAYEFAIVNCLQF